jgi:adenylate cyclase
LQAFYSWIDRLRAAAPDDRAEVEAKIWAEYGVEKAVFALDMSQFSLFVRRNGILAYLGLIREMQQATVPVVESAGGHVVKCEADNLLALFDTPQQAIAAGVSINRLLDARRAQASDRPLEVSIGIDFGRILWIQGADCFGDPVNLAFKLGEDLAHAREILVTDRVREALGESTPYPIEELRMSISGLELTAYRVHYSATRPA